MENWKTIDLYPDYEISDHGNVRRTLTGRVLKPIGNHQVKLAGKQRSLNRIVARHFVGHPPSPTAVVLHRDGDRGNCSAENLVWALRPKRRSWDADAGRYVLTEWEIFDGPD